MGRLASLYNNTNLEKEITTFYEGVQTSSLDYIKSVLMDNIDEELTVDENRIEINSTETGVVSKIEQLLYKVPGKLIVGKSSTIIQM